MGKREMSPTPDRSEIETGAAQNSVSASLDAVLGRAAEALSEDRQLAALRLAASRTLNAAALPQSAPVSSLLPPLPPATSPSAVQAAQLALLLNQAAPGSSQAQNLLQAAASSQLPLRNDSASAVFGAAGVPSNTRTSRIFNPLVQHHARTTNLAATIPTAAEMQNWSLAKLQKHAQLLKKLGQPVPQTLALQLAEARRKEEKKQAKRVANRISASSSRQRKKTMVKEMTEMNQYLKRQALILALLPDLVIVVNDSGVITFCSAQVERVLHHKIDDLMGVPLVDILVPSSRNKFNNLMKRLLDYEKAATNGIGGSGTVSVKELTESGEIGIKASKKSKQAKKSNSKDNRSIPIKEVQVTGKATEEVNDNSDMSLSNQESSNKEPSTLTRSPTSSSMERNNSDDKNCKEGSSDNSNTSSLSMDAKKLQKANANLANNVRWHNKQRKEKQSAQQGGFLDDVTGAEVTANNAGARLSSLLQRPEPPSSGEDSGYRESNDSREETSSSSDSSESNRRPKPIAPTCNVCLIKSDLGTIWCEVTSSIRSGDKGNEEEQVAGDDKQRRGFKPVPGSKVLSKGNDSLSNDPLSTETASSESKEEVKEFLLCLRPIRDGTEKVDEKLKFVPARLRNLPPTVSESSKSSGGEGSKGNEKKRENSNDEETLTTSKRARVSPGTTNSSELHNAAVVESLMQMSSTKKSDNQ